MMRDDAGQGPRAARKLPPRPSRAFRTTAPGMPRGARRCWALDLGGRAEQFGVRLWFAGTVERGPQSAALSSPSVGTRRQSHWTSELGKDLRTSGPLGQDSEGKERGSEKGGGVR